MMAAAAAQKNALPTVMKAIQIHQTGGIEVLSCTNQLPLPQVAPGHLLVKNHFVGVNFIDTYHRSGLYKVPLPYVPGREASGIVQQVGQGVQGFSVGDRVCYTTANCYAEFVSVPAGTILFISH
jgi:NADPH:quinone reductase